MKMGRSIGSISSEHVLKCRETECLKQLKTLVKDDSNLDAFSTFFTDNFLLHFVRGKKYNAQSAYKTLVNYIEVRRDKYPETFKDIRPQKLIKYLEMGVFKVLRNRDAQGRLIVIALAAKWDPHKLPVEDLIKLICIITDELLNEEDFEKNGIIQIYDLSGFGFKHAKVSTPFIVQKLVNIFVNAYPLRLKGYHLVNEMYMFNIVLNALKIFIPKSIQNRLHMHSNNLQSMHEFISKDILPNSLGGNLAENDAFMDITYLQDKLIGNEEFYKKFAEKL